MSRSQGRLALALACAAVLVVAVAMPIWPLVGVAGVGLLGQVLMLGVERRRGR